ncbi:DUF6789 family protein [Coprobacter secundus]|uniref:Uncharacterized protein n=1 Tax=Coprobacter secundus subsp. similis TaxID=2751153 RepID=A0A7G1HYA6_9BACT|nr:DUF6789 family protein [Coprobacter secundus]BCI64705.1 hypothetical protein Cop2CBH44_30580 [Coprobacter secundus subsp. similis]CCY37121.1 putative uncharacterized protein [Tannerella sp. CAG:118]
MKKLQLSLIGGFFATVFLLLVIGVEDMTGILSFDTPKFLIEWSSGIIWVEWLIHLLSGWLFAIIYSFLFIRVLAWIPSNVFRGTVYGLLIAILLQVIMFMTDSEIMENDLLMASAGIAMAYIAYGAVLGMIVNGKK